MCGGGIKKKGSLRGLSQRDLIEKKGGAKKGKEDFLSLSFSVNLFVFFSFPHKKHEAEKDLKEQH